MSAQSRIETATSEFHGGALYEDLGAPTPVRLTQGALLSPLSAAFDLAEGRHGRDMPSGSPTLASR